MRTFVKLTFDVDPAFKQEFQDEANRLKITMTELLRQMWEKWKKEKKEE